MKKIVAKIIPASESARGIYWHRGVELECGHRPILRTGNHPDIGTVVDCGACEMRATLASRSANHSDADALDFSVEAMGR